MMAEFARFWLLLAGITCAWLLLWWMSNQTPWHIRVNFTEVMIVTPWGAIWIADKAYDACQRRLFSGVEILKRNSNPYDKVHRIFDTVYLYTAEERWL